MYLALLAVTLAGYALWTWVCLERNVRKARQMGLPVVRLPINSTNVLWMLLEANVWYIVDSLPFSWMMYPEWFRFLRRGWPFREKAAAHERHGPVWALVSSVRIDVYVADPEIIGEVFRRRRELGREVENYQILNVFGPNITSADNENWARHRKALAAPFNERIMSMVWTEASKQADAISRSWSKSGIGSVQTDVRQLSLNVLAAVGFGKSYDFETNDLDETNWRGTLQIVLDNAILLMLMPYSILTMSIMPESWKRIGRAGDAFRKHMSEMLNAETAAIRSGEKGTSGVIASLVRAMDIHQTDTPTGTTAKGLSEEELFGNMFVINFAGHDTTSNALTFALYLLAAHPSVQDWIAEEIQAATSTQKEWTYENLFEKLPRCRAVLYETLRTHPTTFLIPKSVTSSHPQTLTTRTISLPPKTGIMLNMYACHHDPAIYPEPLEWKPSRWILSGQRESLFTPPPNTYFPFSDGPQNCPGKRFAEVEIVATLAAIFKENKLRVKRSESETAEMALERLKKVIDDVDFQILSKMRDPERVRFIYDKV